jgi:N-acetylmuramic acid 6-phosphate (MurNAc-6-P) etherase
MSDCLICERVALAKQGRNPYVIAEMEHSYFMSATTSSIRDTRSCF